MTKKWWEDSEVKNTIKSMEIAGRVVNTETGEMTIIDLDGSCFYVYSLKDLKALLS